MSKVEIMSARVEGGKIIIELPIDFLTITQKYRSDLSYEVNDEISMANYVAENILTYDEEEDGTTAFHKLVDGLFDEAYESGENWLDETDEEFDEVKWDD
jgi:hypothetical protein